MDSTQIICKGRPFNGSELTSAVLLKSGVGPKSQLTVGGRELYFSDPFYASTRKAPAFIGYVSQGDNYVARTFFFSGSQGLARVLLRYDWKNKGGVERVTWHDKGYGEESIALSFAIQKHLQFLLDSNEVLQVSDDNLLFYGTADDINSEGDYAEEIAKLPKLLEGYFYTNTKGLKIPPDKLAFINEQDSPDFSKVVDQWEFEFNRKRVMSYIFNSYNNSFKYLFNRLEEKAWVGGVEVDSSLTSLGVNEEWVKSGDLTTPLMEYSFERADVTGGYGNESLRDGKKVSMWENYLSKVAVIQRFLGSLDSN